MATEVAVHLRTTQGPARLVTAQTDAGVHLGTAHDLPRTPLAEADVALAAEHGRPPAAIAALRRLAAHAWLLAEGPDGAVPDASLRASLREVAAQPAAFAERFRAASLRPVIDAAPLGAFEARGDVLAGRTVVVDVAVPSIPEDVPSVSLGGFVADWAEGRTLPSPALALALRAREGERLRQAGMALEHWEVAPNVRMLPLRTPTLPPATHTNAFLLGDEELLIVEPASPFEDEIDRLVAHVDAARADGAVLRGILLTHHHPDHVGGAMALRARLGAPILAHARTAERLAGEVHVDRHLDDGERLSLAGRARLELELLHTPGHAPGHLCVLERRSGALLAGDMVAGVGTILVEPHDGDMRLYLESLSRLRALGSTMILPAHGGVVRDPSSWLGFYVAHRLAREAKIAEALRTLDRPSDVDAIVPLAYADTAQAAWPLARMATRAHLDKLIHEGRVVRGPGGFELVRSAPASVN